MENPSECQGWSVFLDIQHLVKRAGSPQDKCRDVRAYTYTAPHSSVRASILMALFDCHSHTHFVLLINLLLFCLKCCCSFCLVIFVPMALSLDFLLAENSPISFKRVFLFLYGSLFHCPGHTHFVLWISCSSALNHVAPVLSSSCQWPFLLTFFWQNILQYFLREFFKSFFFKFWYDSC